MQQSSQEAKENPGSKSRLCRAGARRLRVSDGPWSGEKSVDIEFDCSEEGLSYDFTVGLVIGLSFYYMLGILMAFMFSLPKFVALKKGLYTSYLLWFFFGVLGAHRFYLKQVAHIPVRDHPSCHLSRSFLPRVTHCNRRVG